MNRKGILMWCMIPAYMVWASGAMVVAAVALTPSHRERKVIEKCIAAGNLENSCKEQVKVMSKSDILAYIKDDAPGMPTHNFTHR